MNEIKRGEIYWVSWNPARGSEQSGHRPALVIQNDTGNRTSPTTIVAAVTTSSGKSYPFMVPVSLKESRLPKDSVINLSQIVTVDKGRLGARCGVLGHEKMAEVDKAIKVSLGLE
ncbi:MAG: type II toxin-antitoxin system PemK/MazF family toxin [Dehalococcoidia bacterium]|nr:type II toxin-antitoxin system PemK/MazF family toxin [Dehalococcoidia bacterium]